MEIYIFLLSYLFCDFTTWIQFSFEAFDKIYGISFECTYFHLTKPIYEIRKIFNKFDGN